jgi:hypothetical protein
MSIFEQATSQLRQSNQNGKLPRILFDSELLFQDSMNVQVAGA